MRSRRWTILLTVLLIGLMMMSACAPRPTGGEGATRAGEADLVVDLPALVLDIQEDGSLSMGDIPLADLAAVAGQGDLASMVSVPADAVDTMIASGIDCMGRRRSCYYRWCRRSAWRRSHCTVGQVAAPYHKSRRWRDCASTCACERKDSAAG